MKVMVVGSALAEVAAVRNSRDLPGMADFDHELRNLASRRQRSSTATITLPTGIPDPSPRPPPPRPPTRINGAQIGDCCADPTIFNQVWEVMCEDSELKSQRFVCAGSSACTRTSLILNQQHQPMRANREKS
jgi:hypothetical protein